MFAQRLPAFVSMVRSRFLLPLLFLSTVLAGSASVSRIELQLADLVHEPTHAQWAALARYDDTLTRAEFINRLNTVFDPWHGLPPYVKIGTHYAIVYPIAGYHGRPLVAIRFASSDKTRHARPVSYRPPVDWHRPSSVHSAKPLLGLRVAIEPADIGGAWAKLEDRCVDFKGYGRICEGNLNVIVGRLLRERLQRLGATVFLVRTRDEPILPMRRDHLLAATKDLLFNHPALLPESLRHWADGIPAKGGADQKTTAAGLFLTKTLETRARANLIRRSFRPDITIVLQHDATPESAEGKVITAVNRNIFFVDGAYQKSELEDAHQRFRLLSKALEDVTPVETKVAVAIADQFRAATGYPPVLYGNSPNTRLVVPKDGYVVARNLQFNREHDGPVVVTEPYFMNQKVTLARLLAGNYRGTRVIDGRRYQSIYREYADCVADGILQAYTR